MQKRYLRFVAPAALVGAGSLAVGGAQATPAPVGSGSSDAGMDADGAACPVSTQEPDDSSIAVPGEGYAHQQYDGYPSSAGGTVHAVWPNSSFLPPEATGGGGQPPIENDFLANDPVPNQADAIKYNAPLTKVQADFNLDNAGKNNGAMPPVLIVPGSSVASVKGATVGIPAAPTIAPATRRRSAACRSRCRAASRCRRPSRSPRRRTPARRPPSTSSSTRPASSRSTSPPTSAPTARGSSTRRRRRRPPGTSRSRATWRRGW